MKKSIGLFLCVLFLFSAHAYGHPGKTDYRGGHKCWKKCSEWEIGYGEYHLHDEDWKPIKLDRQSKKVRPEKIMVNEDAKPLEQTYVVATTAENQVAKVPERKEVATNNQDITVYEESILPINAILLLILAILLLIALIFIRKKKNEKK